MRATLHDELMHEAGFETDYHRELERRREQRRRLIVQAAIRAVWLLLAVAGSVELWGEYVPGLPKAVVVCAVVFGYLFNLVAFVQNRLRPWMEDQI